MSNWACVLAYNNVHLTKAAVASLQAQDIEGGVQVLVVENASKDGTGAWLDSRPDLTTLRLTTQDSVAGCWNRALRWLFIEHQAPYVLVTNNDIKLRPDSYRWLVADGGLFVTCVGKRDPECVEPPFIAPDPANKRPHPDYSCYLMRRECFERVGEFDEGFKRAMCEDWDHHWRLQSAGIRAECLELPFYHYGSATVKCCDSRERLDIQRQADLNREFFKHKWGVAGGSPEYYEHFASGPPPEEPAFTAARDSGDTPSA